MRCKTCGCGFRTWSPPSTPSKPPPIFRQECERWQGSGDCRTRQNEGNARATALGTGNGKPRHRTLASSSPRPDSEAAQRFSLFLRRAFVASCDRQGMQGRRSIQTMLKHACKRPPSKGLRTFRPAICECPTVRGLAGMAHQGDELRRGRPRASTNGKPHPALRIAAPSLTISYRQRAAPQGGSAEAATGGGADRAAAGPPGGVTPGATLFVANFLRL